MNTEATFYRHLKAKGHRLLLALLMPATFAYSATAAATATLPEQLIGAAQVFLEQAVPDYLQRSDISGRHEIEISRLDPRLRLPICDKELTTTLESPAQPIGRVTLRVRCDGLSPWTIFVPAQVRLYREVVTAIRPLKRGSVVSEFDVGLAERDVGLLNHGYLTALSQAIGKKLTRPVRADQEFTPVYVEQAEVIRRGDQVVISAKSGTINVRMPGEALSDGALGRQINVRNQRSQRIIKARVTGPGQVEVAM